MFRFWKLNQKKGQDIRTQASDDLTFWKISNETNYFFQNYTSHIFLSFDYIMFRENGKLAPSFYNLQTRYNFNGLCIYPFIVIVKIAE